MRHRRRKHDGDRVAHDAVQRSVVAKGNLDQLLEIVVEKADRLFRLAAFHEPGKILQVSENKAACLAPAAQFELLRMLDSNEWPLALGYALASVLTGLVALLVATNLVRRARVWG